MKLVLLLPDGKRLDETSAYSQWETTTYPKLRPALRAKYPSVLWP